MTERDELLREGDVVEHKMNTNVIGIVVGFQGSLVGIQVAPTLAVLWFHEWTLRRIDENDEYHDGGEGEPVDDDNVIDFTKARDLRTAKAKGAA